MNVGIIPFRRVMASMHKAESGGHCEYTVPASNAFGLPRQSEGSLSGKIPETLLAELRGSGRHEKLNCVSIS